MASEERWTPDPKTGKTRWRSHWRDDRGRPQSRVFRTKAAAKAHGARMESDKLTGSYVDPAAGRITFKAYCEEWRLIVPQRDNTRLLAESQLRKHVYPVIGERPIGSVRTSEIQAMVTGFKLAPSTAEVVYGRVAACFKAAVRDRLIPVSPCVDIKRPKGSTKVDNVLSTDQVLALAEAVPARYRTLVLAGAGTGLRPGELFGLTVPAVDFLRRELRVDRQLVRIREKGGGVELTDLLKTDSSRRKLPIAQVVVDLLAAHIAEHTPHPDLGLIFTDDEGEPIQQAPFGRVWHSARRKARVPAWAKGPHHLRHHFASLLIARGSSVKVVQKRLGHGSAKTTLDTYGHLWPDDEDATRKAVEDELGAALRVAATG